MLAVEPLQVCPMRVIRATAGSKPSHPRAQRGERGLEGARVVHQRRQHGSSPVLGLHGMVVERALEDLGEAVRLALGHEVGVCRVDLPGPLTEGLQVVVGARGEDHRAPQPLELDLRGEVPFRASVCAGVGMVPSAMQR